MKVVKRFIIGALGGGLLGLACLEAMFLIYDYITYEFAWSIVIAAPFSGAILFVLLGHLNDKEKEEISRHKKDCEGE